jgi:hypothetical protein
MTETRIPLTDVEIALITELLLAETHRRGDSEPIKALLVKFFAYEESLQAKTARQFSDILVRRGVVKPTTGRHALEITGTEIREDPFDLNQ